jgi:hypothetical protein
MIIYNKKNYSFNLPQYLGFNYVSVDVVFPNTIQTIHFYDETGQNHLFSATIYGYTQHLINPNTLAYIKAKIDETVF